MIDLDPFCRNCEWARWEMTTHVPPRANRKRFGRCVYPLPRLDVPMVLDLDVEDMRRRLARQAIWWDYTTPCETFRAKEASRG